MTRSMRIGLILFVIACPFVVTSAFAGEHQPNRTAFFIGLGGGWANAGAEVQGVSTDRENSFSGNFRFGWAVMDNMTVGLESSSWVKEYDLEGTGFDLKMTATVTTFAATYFPHNMGFYFRGGLGFATGKAELSNGSTTIGETETGVGWLAASGYEWRLTEKFALGPQVQYAFLDIGGDGTDSVDFVAMTLQANWYW